MELRNRRRLQLILIAIVFASPVIIAAVLAASGFVPEAHSYGKPITPERNLATVKVQLADGHAFAWRNPSEWTLVALPGPGCRDACLRQLDLMHRAQIALNQQSDKLRLLYLGTPPAGPDTAGFGKVWTLATTSSTALDDLRARAPDSLSAVLVTPRGEALTRYPAPIDVTRLSADLHQAVR